jgi:hypothetical protein
LLPVILLVGIVTLFVAVVTLRSPRRSEALGEARHEILRDQHERSELMREERRALAEELERESRERQLFMEDLRPHLLEVLKRKRQARTESANGANNESKNGCAWSSTGDWKRN